MRGKRNVNTGSVGSQLLGVHCEAAGSVQVHVCPSLVKYWRPSICLSEILMKNVLPWGFVYAYVISEHRQLAGERDVVCRETCFDTYCDVRYIG